jgi:zinc transporter 1/2/3
VKITFISLIIIFAIFTPIGIGLGLILSGSSKLVEGIILAISTGTFIYVAASEVIVEEFAVTKYKFSKFFLYLIGGIFVGGLAMVEVLYGDED